jgi:hypothetical protein
MSAVAGLEMTSAILLHRLVPQLQNGSFLEVAGHAGCLSVTVHDAFPVASLSRPERLQFARTFYSTYEQLSLWRACLRGHR